MEHTENRGPVIYIPKSRRTFIKGAGVAGLLAVMTAGTNSGARAASFAKANLRQGDDAEVLNFALSLEHLEATFYRQVVDSGVLDDDGTTVLSEIRDHEIEHVDFLTKALSDAGADPVEALESYNFEALGDLSSQAGVFTVSEVLEETGVGAYTGAARLLSNKDYLAAAGSIEQVEARHQAVLRILNGKSASPGALGPVQTPEEVTEAIAPVVGS